MKMNEMYNAMPGSPITYLAGDISAGQTTIAVADDTALPDAPNICTIGYGEHIETIRYGAKSNGVLQNVTRGIEGTPRAWQSGTEVARFFTAYDHNAIINTLTSHLAENMSAVISVSRDVSLLGVQIIETPFKVKSVTCVSFIQERNIKSIGFWAENGTQSCCFDNTVRYGLSNGTLIGMNDKATDAVKGKITKVTKNTIELTWEHWAGNLTGTASIIFLINTHGEEVVL